MWALICLFIVVLFLTALQRDPKKNELIRTEKQGETIVETWRTPDGYEYTQIKPTP